MPGSLMRLKKLPIAVNMSVDVKEVNRPHTARVRNALGCDSSDDAPEGKLYTCSEGETIMGNW